MVREAKRGTPFDDGSLAGLDTRVSRALPVTRPFSMYSSQARKVFSALPHTLRSDEGNSFTHRRYVELRSNLGATPDNY